MEMIKRLGSDPLLTDVILILLAAGIISTIGPEFLAAFVVIKKYSFARQHSKKEVYDALYNLKRMGKVRYSEKNRLILLKKGRERIKMIYLDDVAVKKPPVWDRKWYVIMYDIPVRFSKAREGIRLKIKELGFYQLQKSVWVYPYSCEQEILFIADFFGVRKFVEVVVAESILHEKLILTHFNLPHST